MTHVLILPHVKDKLDLKALKCRVYRIFEKSKGYKFFHEKHESLKESYFL